jgi:hypothetical protein
MTVTLDLPPHVGEAYLAEAQARGMPLVDLVRQVLMARQPSLSTSGTVFDRGLGLFGSPEDTDSAIEPEERRRPTSPSVEP